MHNENNKDSMDELNKIIDRYTEGNYLIGKTAKEEMAKDILSLFGVSQQRELLIAYERYKIGVFNYTLPAEIDEFLDIQSNL